MRISDWSSDVCSSDLAEADTGQAEGPEGDQPGHLRSDGAWHHDHQEHRGGQQKLLLSLYRLGASGNQHLPRHRGDGGRTNRSEEHTSELQSLMRISYAVFCLKKKKKKLHNNKHTSNK